MAELTVRFWGVRGSLATPGPSTARYGGNTSCVEVRAGDQVIILDMGSGLRELGTELLGIPGLHATFFLSHYHWDHIQGLPFFAPAFSDPDATITVYGATRLGKSVREILAGQMINPYFPVSIGEMQAKLFFRTVESGGHIQIGPVLVTAREMSHPGGSLAFRLQSEGAAIVYATDFEHGSGTDDALIELAQGADLLIFDATYTDAEYKQHKGWGHSTWSMGARIAQLANVKRLVLFHHDPSHDDDQIDEIVRKARKLFPATDAAQEGKSYALPARKKSATAPRARKKSPGRLPARTAAKRAARRS